MPQDCDAYTVFRFYVPLSPNKKFSERHPAVRWEALKSALLAVAGGYTDAGEVEGAWVDDSNELMYEKCRQFEIAVAPDNVELLEAIFWCLCLKFKQEKIYFSSGAKSWMVDARDIRSRPRETVLVQARAALALGDNWETEFVALEANWTAERS